MTKHGHGVEGGSAHGAAVAAGLSALRNLTGDSDDDGVAETAGGGGGVGGVGGVGVRAGAHRAAHLAAGAAGAAAMSVARGSMSDVLDAASKGRGHRKTQRAARIAAMELSQRAAASVPAGAGRGHGAGAHIVRDIAGLVAVNDTDTTAGGGAAAQALVDAPLKEVTVSAEPKWMAAVGNAVGVPEKKQKMVEEVGTQDDAPNTVLC